MSSPYSVINDLYGVETANKQPHRQGALGLIVVMFLGGMVIYESVHPVMRLRSEPPPIYLKSRASRRTKVTRAQGHIAKANWSAAAEYVSEKYTYGKALPNSPPQAFTLAMGGDYATSSLYWQRLRDIWEQPDMWVSSFQVDTAWINSAFDSVGKIVQGYLNS
jgi:hypothetical protein